MASPPTFTVHLDDGSTHVVEVLYGDQLRAELEAPKHAIPLQFEQAPVHTTTLWLWAALTRMGVTSDPFQTFKTHIRLVSRGGDLAPDVKVGPTPQDQGTP